MQRIVDMALAVAVLIGLSFVFEVPFSSAYGVLALLTMLLMWPLFKAMGIYYSYRSDHPAVLYPKVLLAWAGVVMVLLLIGFLTQTTDQFSRILLSTWFVVAPAAMCIHHFKLRMLLRTLRASGLNSRRTVIVGTGPLGQHLAQQIQDTPQLGLQFCGFFTEQPLISGQPLSPRPLIGSMTELPGYVQRHQIDSVYIAFSLHQESITHQLINSLKDTTVCVYFVPNIAAFNLLQAKVDNLNGIPLISLWEVPRRTTQSMAKRLTDLVVAGSLLILTLPLFILIAIAIRASSLGPVWVKQQHYGLQSESIWVYRFRTRYWVNNLDQPLDHKSATITGIGTFLEATSLDMLPQLFNVLQGHMSIVGPRLRQGNSQKDMRELLQLSRLRYFLKPGITGWAQIHEPDLKPEKAWTTNSQDYDLDYLQNWSIWLDLQIIFKATALLLRRRAF